MPAGDMPAGPLDATLRRAPALPGAYIFRDQSGEVLYVGKARSLRERLSHYRCHHLGPDALSRKPRHPKKTRLMLARAASVEWIIVDNEVEALLLENRLIKRHKPRYNILLKDAKTYGYIKVTDERLPRLVTARSCRGRGMFFGPYPDGAARKEVMRLADAAFRLRTSKAVCRRPCLNYHIGLCSGPCVGKVTRGQYLAQVEAAKRFLRGDTSEMRTMLREEMERASRETRYEDALRRRGQIEALDILERRQKVDRVRPGDQDVVALVVRKEKAIVSMFHIAKGVMAGRREYTFSAEEDLLASFIRAYYSGHPIPHEIILNTAAWQDAQDKAALEGYLSLLRGSPVALTLPGRGEKRGLARLAELNAVAGEEALLELMRRLSLPSVPSVIECFDVSHLQGSGIVAGMARYVDGRPDGPGFRRFAIRTVSGESDDARSLAEAVERRYVRLTREDARLPDLVVVDGGRVQLDAVAGALLRCRAAVPVCALAKRHEELYIADSDRPLRLNPASPMMLLLRRLRDSTHRFAIAYNRTRRRRALLGKAQDRHRAGIEDAKRAERAETAR